MNSHTELFSSSLWGILLAHPRGGLVPAPRGHFWAPVQVTVPWLQQNHEQHLEAGLTARQLSHFGELSEFSQDRSRPETARLRQSRGSNSRCEKRALYNQAANHAGGSSPAQLGQVLRFLLPLPSCSLLASRPGAFPHSATAEPLPGPGATVSCSFSDLIPDFRALPPALNMTFVSLSTYISLYLKYDLHTLTYCCKEYYLSQFGFTFITLFDILKIVVW